MSYAKEQKCAQACTHRRVRVPTRGAQTHFDDVFEVLTLDCGSLKILNFFSGW